MKNRILSRDPMVGRIVAWSQVNETRCQAIKATNSIDIFGPIGDFFWDESAITTAQVVAALDELSPDQDVDVRINSPGGEVWEGVSIYNILKSAPQKINVKITGQAASISSIIAMAGDTVEMGTGATMMIHKAWGMAVGNELELREIADIMAAADSTMIDIYHAKTGMARDEITAMLHPDTYMSASKAVELGFADSAATPEPVQARAVIQPSAMSRLFLANR